MVNSDPVPGLTCGCFLSLAEDFVFVGDGDREKLRAVEACALDERVRGLLEERVRDPLRDPLPIVASPLGVNVSIS
jgi:hypothetical protein